MACAVTTREPSDDVACENKDYLDVTFSPQLFLQRQAWILDVLRRERVNSVLDVGCGNGDLLSCLCEPAQTIESAPLPDDPIVDIFEDLHLRRVAGLDVCAQSLQSASDHVLGRVENADAAAKSWQPVRNRWEPLQAKLWHGSLDVFNSNLVYDEAKDTGYEAIVAQEVIEHLQPEALDKFTPVLLSAYRPRLLLVTTPSFDFNERFTAPGVVDDRGYLDPTQRTKRVFRHSDHKLEFTRAEFLEYCERAAARFGYSVSVDCIGTPVEDDPFAHARSLGCATQVAVFTRADARDPAPLSAAASEPHVLHAERFFPAHPGPRLDAPAVLARVRRYLASENEGGAADMHALWYYAGDIAVACGGSLQLLARALAQDGEFEFDARARVTMASQLVWRAFVPKPVAEPVAPPEDDWDASSVSSYPQSEPWAERDLDAESGLDSSIISTGSGWGDDALHSAWESWGGLENSAGAASWTSDWTTAEPDTVVAAA